MIAEISTRTAAVLLAAGASRRFGSDKRLHRLDGTPMVVRTAERYVETFGKLFVVLREDDEAIARLVEPLQPDIVIAVIAQDAAQGMGRSLAAGIAAASDHPFAFVALADMPFVQPSTLLQLLELAAPECIVRPLHRGTPGHPVGFAADYFEALKQLEGDQGAREVIRRHARSLVQLWTDDPGVVRDVDRP